MNRDLRPRFCFLLLLLCPFCLLAQKPKGITEIPIEDSVKAAGFYSQLRFGQAEKSASIGAGPVRLAVSRPSRSQGVIFSYPRNARVQATGSEVQSRGERQLYWPYKTATNVDYKMYIATASDSAENMTLYSGYVFLPEIGKWKLIGTVKVPGHWGALKQVSTQSFARRKNTGASFTAKAIQRANGSWKQLDTATSNPSINLASHVDSLDRLQIERALIRDYVTKDSLKNWQEKEDVHFAILAPGTGRQVALTDTVEVFYKGYLFPNGTVFDQTKDKPARFPLSRLIRGWQIAIPYLREGGRVRIIIPSSLAYSIRTRSPRIPPNSILVFEVEVVRATQ